ncbi:MAG: lysylphosphatidylglycerol synthase transmembrane domain-containing protein [Anaerolineales bacterium]|jgi:uncharacterized protein (TIRG00374 family)
MVEDSLHHQADTQEKTASPVSRKLIYGLLFGFLVFVALILVGDIRQIGAEVRSFPWQIMPVVLGLTLWNYLLRFIKWHYFLQKVEVPNLSILDSARLFVAGFPLAVTPAKVGETLKGVWLNQLTGFPTARGVSVVLAERISDGLAMLVLSTVGVIAYRRYWPAFAIVLGLLLGAVIISQIRPLAHYLLSWGPRIPLVRRFANSINEFYEGTFTLFKPWTTFVSVSLGTISWMAEGVGFYLILVGLGVTPGVGTLSIAIFVLSFSTVIGAVSALPGGLLAADASIVGMLVLLLGMDTNTAAAATLLIRFATLWFGVGIGFITWFFSRDLLTMRLTQPLSQNAPRE